MNVPVKSLEIEHKTQSFGEKLLIPGWAGELTKEEMKFIKEHLKTDRRLRARWGMGRGHGRISEEKIREVARGGKVECGKSKKGE